MKRIRFGAVIAMLILALSLTACTKKNEQPADTDQTVTQDANTVTQEPDVDVTLTEKDAQALVLEKLPDGYTAEFAGNVSSDNHEYLVFQVKDAAGNDIGDVAIDTQSGERYNYEGEGYMSDYSNFALYDENQDAVCDWNGTFTKDAEHSVSLAQADSNSFEYSFTADKSGIARITGNTASDTNQTIRFIFTSETAIHIEDTDEAYTGDYVLSEYGD